VVHQSVLKVPKNDFLQDVRIRTGRGMAATVLLKIGGTHPRPRINPNQIAGELASTVACMLQTANHSTASFSELA
jgi:hypothetical protein